MQKLNEVLEKENAPPQTPESTPGKTPKTPASNLKDFLKQRAVCI
jgi:hypothetical protein